MRIAGIRSPLSLARSSTVSRTRVTMYWMRVRKLASARRARSGCECQPPTLLRVIDGTETDSATRRAVISRLTWPMLAEGSYMERGVANSGRWEAIDVPIAAFPAGAGEEELRLPKRL